MARTIVVGGGWVRVPYDGTSTARLVVEVDGDRHRAWFDCDGTGGWAVARVAAGGGPGVGRVTLSADGRPVWTGRIRR